jgi:transposase-like protein
MTSTSPLPLWTTWGKGFTRRCSPVALRAPSAQRRRPASYTTSRDAPQAFPGQGQMKPEQAEIERLRREVQKLKAERDILKKAAAYFAKDQT